MGYDEDPRMVRVDFFKPSGKWYTTEAVRWVGYSDPLIHDALRFSLRKHLGNRLQEMTAVCLHPYHKLSHPIMVRGW